MAILDGLIPEQNSRPLKTFPIKGIKGSMSILPGLKMHESEEMLLKTL